MKSISVPCAKCGGTGHAVLSPVLSRTLHAIPTGKDASVTTADIFEALKDEDGELTQQAVNNRLTQLVQLGLVYHAANRGRSILWMLTRAGQKSLSK